MYNFYNQLARIISNILKKLNLKKHFTNKLIYNVGLNGLLSNKKFYENAKNINTPKNIMLTTTLVERVFKI